MRTINQMVIQPNIPNNNRVLWLNGNSASYYNNGTWVTIGKSSEDRQELEEKVDSLDKEVGQIKKELKDYTYTLPAATKTTLGGIKAGTNIVNIADVDNATAPQVAGVVNTLLNQLRAAGILIS